MSATLSVFSYGSLVEEPSCPDRVRSVELAWASDWSRSFHLTSTYRGCSASAARYPLIVEPSLTDGVFRRSLVLGARPDPGARIAGAVVTWEDPDGEVLREIDRREGVDPRYPTAGPYLRTTCRVQVLGRSLEVLTYASNPHHPRFVELSLEQQARALLHATPAVPDRDRGALYLLPLVGYLRRHGIDDPYLEALVRHMEAEVGTLPTPVRRSGPYSGT